MDTLYIEQNAERLSLYLNFYLGFNEFTSILQHSDDCESSDAVESTSAQPENTIYPVTELFDYDISGIFPSSSAELNDSSLTWKNRYYEKCEENREILSELSFLRELAVSDQKAETSHTSPKLKDNEQTLLNPPTKRQRTGKHSTRNRSDGQKPWKSDLVQTNLDIQSFINVLINDTPSKPLCLHVTDILTKYTRVDLLNIDHLLKISETLKLYHRNLMLTVVPKSGYRTRSKTRVQNSLNVVSNEGPNENSGDNSLIKHVYNKDWFKYTNELFGEAIEMYYLCYRSIRNSPNDRDSQHITSVDMVNEHGTQIKRKGSYQIGLSKHRPWKCVAYFAVQVLTSMATCNLMTRYDCIEQLCKFVIERSPSLSIQNEDEDGMCEVDSSVGNRSAAFLDNVRKTIAVLSKHIDVDESLEGDTTTEQVRVQEHQQLKMFLQREQRTMIQFISKVVHPVLANLVESARTTDMLTEIISQNALQNELDLKECSNLKKNILEGLTSREDVLESLRSTLIQNLIIHVPNIKLQSKIMDMKWNILL